MKRIFYRIMSYMAMLVLGMYMSSQFRHNQPVELHRWLLTTMFFLMFLVFANDKEN